jgi:hypothetical protein
VNFPLEDHLTSLLAYVLLNRSTDGIGIDCILTHHSFIAGVSYQPYQLCLPYPSA